MISRWQCVFLIAEICFMSVIPHHHRAPRQFNTFCLPGSGFCPVRGACTPVVVLTRPWDKNNPETRRDMWVILQQDKNKWIETERIFSIKVTHQIIFCPSECGEDLKRWNCKPGQHWYSTLPEHSLTQCEVIQDRVNTRLSEWSWEIGGQPA